MRPATAATFPGATPTARHPNCVRLHSLADGANGAPPCGVPDNSAGGPHGPEMLPAPGAGAAPRCSIVSPESPPSRAAVTGVTSHTGAQATLSAAHGLTARAAHNVPPSAGSGIARPADVPAKRSPFASGSRLPQPATVALPGRRRLTSSADGPQRSGARPGSGAWAVRGCSTSSLGAHPTTPSEPKPSPALPTPTGGHA